MSLNKLCLFKNVKITPDYSVVHDMDSDTWKDYLMGWLDPMPPDANPPENVFYDEHVNYYRMPETIRIEANYDIIRTATYGYLEDGLTEGNPSVNVSFRRIFFWVDDVRILKQFCNRDLTSSPIEYKDVIELDITIDVWSSYAGQFKLYDSFVERRHMPRWKEKTVGGVTTYEPIYYPNAAQGIEGAYQQEAVEDLTPWAGSQVLPGLRVDPKYILINYIDKSTGELKILIGVDIAASYQGSTTFNKVWHIYNTSSFFGVKEVLDSSLFTAAGLVAEYVQSIVVLPYIAGLTECIRYNLNDQYFSFLETDPRFADFTIATPVNGITWITLNGGLEKLNSLMEHHYSTPTVIAPDHDLPSYGQYIDQHEPMMYYTPARQRKIVTGMGGTVADVPDIDAFQDTYTLQNVIDLNTAITLVYGGTDIKEANAIGNMGTTEAATLPIYNSAWKSYEAISKVSDNMMYNAKQLQTVGNGLGGSALSAVGGFLMGGAGGAVLGLASGILGTATGVYGNDVELEAKRVQIKNSPATVKSGGSGLGAYVLDFIDVWYMTLKLDDVSMEKLRFMYYWYGYHVNRMERGDVELYTRRIFDFIKTSGAKVRGELTAGAAKQIAAIFDHGVTIYHGKNGYVEIGQGQLINNDEVEP